MNIDELVKECHKTAKEKGFWNGQRNIGELLMLITSELSEALEADRKGRFADLETFENCVNAHEEDKSCCIKKSFERFMKDTFEDEIADTFIRLFDLCGGLDIDIEKHIKYKMEFNKNREKLHGKKY